MVSHSLLARAAYGYVKHSEGQIRQSLMDGVGLHQQFDLPNVQYTHSGTARLM